MTGASLKMEDARIRRTQRRSVLARHVNTLNRLLIEEKIHDVQSRLESMSATYVELETAHYAYHDKLEDDKVVQESEKWFEDVTNDYLKHVSKAKLWLKEAGVETKVDMRPIVSSGKPAEASEVSQLSKELTALLHG